MQPLLPLLAVLALVATAACGPVLVIDGAAGGGPAKAKATKKPSAEPSAEPSDDEAPSATPSASAAPTTAPPIPVPKKPKPTATPTASAKPTPLPTPTATPSPTPSPLPTSVATARPSFGPMGSPTPTPLIAAQPAEIAAARTFPFTTVGQVWHYKSLMKAGTFNLPGTRDITVTAVEESGATVRVLDLIDTSKIPLGAQSGPKTFDRTYTIRSSDPDPYLPFTLALFEAAPGASPTPTPLPTPTPSAGDPPSGPAAATYQASSLAVLGVDTPVVVQSYSVNLGSQVDVSNHLAAGKGIVYQQLVGKKMPPSLLPKEFASFASFGFKQDLTLESITP